MRARDAEDLMAAALSGDEAALKEAASNDESLIHWQRAAAVYRRKREMSAMNSRTPSKPFLTAKWQYLAMLNYEIDPSILAPYVPQGTELDQFNGVTYLSLVCFRFVATKVLGVSIPFHRNFEEINLRFYVRRRVGSEIRRGVVFIKEIVPRAAITAVARILYNENYETHPTGHKLALTDDKTPSVIEYWWGHSPIKLSLRVNGEPTELLPDSEEEFITEHYWGYTRQRDGSTLEYQVMHPRWKVWPVDSFSLNGDPSTLYDKNFGAVLSQKPRSALLALGSDVAVFRGQKLDC